MNINTQTIVNEDKLATFLPLGTKVLLDYSEGAIVATRDKKHGITYDVLCKPGNLYIDILREDIRLLSEISYKIPAIPVKMCVYDNLNKESADDIYIYKY